MRVRNKELHQRWHRKAQRIKEIRKELMEAGAAKPKPEKAPPKPKAEKPAAAKKSAAPKVDAAAKPKKAPAKKKGEAPEHEPES